MKLKKFTNNLNCYNFVFAQYKMSLKFGEIKFKKKEFHRSKPQMSGFIKYFESNTTTCHSWLMMIIMMM